METRANYVLIGAFTLAGFVGLLGFALWFARVELDRQFAYYDVRFSSVSGLSRASDVRFAGLPVGQVVDVRLSPDGDGTVLVRLEVGRDTPVRVDSVATIESQGVTGVSYVGISAGERSQPLLTAEQGFPEITAGRSVLQTLSEDAPEIVTEALRVVRQIGDLLSDENAQRIQSILDNLESSSSDLGQALNDFAVVTSVVATASTDIANFTVQLEPAISAVTNTLAVLDTTMETFSALADRAKSSLDEGDAALVSGRLALDAAAVFMTQELPLLMAELTATATTLRTTLDSVGGATNETLAQFGVAGVEATARLRQAETTLAAADEMIARISATMETIEQAATSFDAMIEGDATTLMAETRAMIANADSAVTAISTVVEQQLPGIVADIRAATETAARVVTEVGADLSAATGRIDGLADGAAEALAQVAETFGAANRTLAAINGAVDTADRALAAAERTFAGADRVIAEDIGPITADLRAAMARLDAALARVTDDIPAVTADLRAAAAAASGAFDEFGRMVASSGAPVRAFATEGLPQYTRLARETRDLIANLEQLTRAISRDPARFFLNRQTPEFRR